MTVDKDKLALVDPQTITEMRRALIDSFVSIINGLKPSSESSDRIVPSSTCVSQQ